ncbi:MAG TPA: type IV secretion system protein, partial [Acidimicrobiales bacterium]
MPALGRAVLGVVLVAVVVTAAWTSTAGAAPAQQEGDCVEVLRWVYDPPDTITPPKGPTDHGRENSISVDPRFLTTYCFRNGVWTLTKDDFPYDAADECIDIFYKPDEHGGDGPPDQVTPLDKIDDYGKVDATGGLTGTEFIEHYCRDGSRWRRTARADDYPAGSYTAWSSECVTIGPPIHDSPQRTTRHPSELGNTEFKEFIETLGPEDLKTYCHHKDRDVWYRVDDYPVSKILGDDARLEHPDEGTCVVLREIDGLHTVESLPEVIPGFGHPGDYGWFQEKQEFRDWNGGRDAIDPKQTYCYMYGAWRRADTLTNICDTLRQETSADAMSRGVLPDQCWGAYPTSKYDIGYDSGSFWDFDFAARLYGWWTGFFFDIGKGATQVSLWAIGWAFDFDISDYDQFGLVIGEDYRKNLVENPPFRLVEIAWLALFAWAGFNALRGKLSMAAGEIVVSIVLVGLSTVLIANRDDYMTATWDLMDKASAALLVAGQGKDPAAAPDEAGPAVLDVQKQIHGVFVEQTYDYLNWGHPLSGDCATARNQAVVLGPHESDPMPRDLMKDAGCDAEADFNAKPTGTRMLGAILAMLASFVVAFVLISVSLTIVIAKFGAMLLFALAPFAALAVIFPAGGRRLAWLWVTTLIQMILAVVGMSFLLSVLLLGLRRLLEETADVTLVERFFIVNLCVLVIAMARRRLLAGSQASAGRLADNLTNVRLGGGGAAWQGPSGSAGANLLNIDRGMRHAGWAGAVGAGAALAGTGRIIAQRRRESRAWHNIITARRRGDRMAGVQHRTYYSDAPGGSHGPG